MGYPVTALVSRLHQVLAKGTLDPDGNMSYDSNPILDSQPVFARSLPIQVLLTGIIFTLTCVLVLHLLFTAQYHWPLAPVNFVLQLSGVFSLLISQIATIHVVTSATLIESQNWPYMLTYLAVDIPPLNQPDGLDQTGNPNQPDNSGWTTAELAAWLIMNAVTSGLIQITHIQFLTLLYPSTLEKRLILFLLAPLAILSAVMQLLPIHSNEKVVYWADAISNVCNATLSLMFTLSLLLWGFFVKRHAAWRTDGGTATFGAGAIFLAVASTTLTFVYIPIKEQFDWLQGLIWAVILWQSFFGWWWWVGSGMATYSNGREGVEEALRREEKRDRKRKARKARRSAQKEKARTMFRGVTNTFGQNPRDDGLEENAHSLDASGNPDPSLAASPTTAESTTASDMADSRFTQFFLRWYLSIRHAHRVAARQQAVERSERINQAYEGRAGWGLGSFAMRRRDRRESSDDGSGPEEIELDAPARRKRPMVEDTRSSSVSWWGPFRKWRLQDRTVY